MQHDVYIGYYFYDSVSGIDLPNRLAQALDNRECCTTRWFHQYPVIS